jgi:hypothetical protein
MMAEELELWARTAATSTRLALTAQVALVGQLASALVAGGALSAKDASEMIEKIADVISSSADQHTTDLQAVMITPIREHAEALRRVAGDVRRLSVVPQ